MKFLEFVSRVEATELRGLLVPHLQEVLEMEYGILWWHYSLQIILILATKELKKIYASVKRNVKREIISVQKDTQEKQETYKFVQMKLYAGWLLTTERMKMMNASVQRDVNQQIFRFRKNIQEKEENLFWSSLNCWKLFSLSSYETRYGILWLRKIIVSVNKVKVCFINTWNNLLFYE